MRRKVGIWLMSERPQGLPRAVVADRHCGHVERAMGGEAFHAGSEDVSCPLARYALGMDPPRGRAREALVGTLVGWGDSDNADLARAFLERCPRLEHAERFIAYAPLEGGEVALGRPPDVVVQVLSPDEAMWTVRDRTRTEGRRTRSSCSGVGAMCSECTAGVVLSGDWTMSVGCSGSRTSLELRDGEMFLATPGL